MFTSRSAIECYQDCNRYRYNQYFLGGKGVVLKQKSVPLVTGGAIHRGVEHLLNRVRIGQEPDIEVAVQEAVNQYIKDVEGIGFTGKGLQTDKQQWFTFNEQKALVEALVRAWYIVELPNLVKRFKILAVEREIQPIEIAPGIMFQSRVDAEFQEIETKDYFNYSLKSCKQWGEMMEASYKDDLQGLTEIWAVESDAARQSSAINNILNLIELFKDCQTYPHKNLDQISKYLATVKIDKRISGTRFCYLVKGTRKKPDYFSNDPDALMITYNPLIRGYKRITPSSVEYAHSWFYPNSENKSGKSAIGRGWEPFNVWEEMGVNEWMEMIPSIQTECEDPIRGQVVTPIEYSRNEGEIEEAMEEIVQQEIKVNSAVRALDGSWNSSILPFNIDTNSPTMISKFFMDSVFSHNRKHCHYHFGGTCEYYELCWSPEVKADPLASGLYQIREAHHEAERNQ
jgi:hypothetical protein